MINAHIQAAFPDLVIETIRPLRKNGQFNDLYVVNERLIFRFPRSPYVAREMRTEIALLRHLRGRLPLPIPDPIYVAESDAEIRFMGYPMIPGEPVMRATLSAASDETLRRFAGQLADFLRALHSAPILPLPVIGRREDWAALFVDFERDLFPHMRPDARQTVSAAFNAALHDDALWEFTPVLHHGDFGTRNILYDPQSMQVTGVIDFGACGVGDPAQDVGALWSLGDGLMPHFFAAYPEMRATIRRVAFIRSTYALQQAYYALRDGDQAEFEDGISAYR